MEFRVDSSKRSSVNASVSLCVIVLQVYREYNEFNLLSRIKSQLISRGQYIQDLKHSFNISTGNLD